MTVNWPVTALTPCLALWCNKSGQVICTRASLTKHCICALEVFLNVMRYINPRFTYLLTYLLVKGRCCSVAGLSSASSSSFIELGFLWGDDQWNFSNGNDYGNGNDWPDVNGNGNGNDGNLKNGNIIKTEMKTFKTYRNGNVRNENGNKRKWCAPADCSVNESLKLKHACSLM